MTKSILKWGGITLLGLLGLLLVVAIFVYMRLNASLPWVEGSRQVSGISETVTITRDAHGIPHISGASDEDVFFGLGYAHAQDRLWQMEVNRRTVRGQLSELMGEASIDFDVFMRSLNFYANAQNAWQTMPAETRGWIEAYTRGVNAVIDDPDFVAPPEFVFLMAGKPKRWTPVESVACLKLIALTLGGNARDELVRAYYAKKLGAEKSAEFLDPPHLPFFVSLKAEDLGIGEVREATDPASTGAMDHPEALDGSPTDQSNNWVLDGSRSVTGKPLLANDPHLGSSQPGIWYMAHLDFPSTSVVGTSIPGIPAVILGHNDTMAWGMTNFGPDVQDLYRITVNPDNPNEYKGPDGWEPFKLRTETIKVRWGDDVTMDFKSTRHGPIMSKDYTSYGLIAEDNEEIALAFTMIDDKDHTIHGMMNIMRSASWETLLNLGPYFIGPTQNVVFADVNGNIGYAAPGKIPVRAADHDSGGRLPVDGSLARNDWQGFYPSHVLPHVLNPKSGMIVTANNKIVPDEYPHALTNDWRATERARRITEMLEAQDKHDLDSMSAVQLDTMSIRSHQLLPLMLAETPNDGDAAAAHALLSSWDGSFEGDRPEPLIYTAWVAHLGKLIYEDDFGTSFRAVWRMRQMFLTSILDGTAPHWCDNLTTEDVSETCGPHIVKALDEAMATLKKAYGRDMTKWRWDEAHQVEFPHQPFDMFPVLGSWFSRKAPHAGGMDTPNVGIYSVRTMPEFNTDWIPSYRALYDLSDLEASRMIIPTGQSGHFLSDHYDDLTAIWARGDYIKVPTQADALGGNVKTLTLEPK